MTDARASIATLQAQFEKAANALHEARGTNQHRRPIVKTELGLIHDESRY